MFIWHTYFSFSWSFTTFLTLELNRPLFLLLHLYKNDPFAYEMINSFELLYILKHLPAYLTYTILPKVLGRPLLMNRFDYFSNIYESSMSNIYDLNVKAYNDILGNCVLLIL